MRYQELKDHIKGSFLTKEYLQAFLIQSAFIEGLLKVYLDFNIFLSTKGVEEEGVLKSLGKITKEFNLFEIIKFLEDSKLISGEQYKNLEKYRIKRNKILHDLLNEITKKDNLEVELIDIYKIGDSIISSKEFSDIGDMVKSVDDTAFKERREKEKNEPKNQKITS